jgi:hypothetical protein
MLHIRRRGTRWIRYGLVAALATAGCDDTKTQPTEGPGDQPAAAGLRLEEAEITAVLGEGGLDVGLVLHRTSPGLASGKVQVRLEKLGQVEPVAVVETDFTASGAATPVQVRLPAVEGLGVATPEAAAGYVVRYRIEWDGTPLFGRRSLFAAIKLAEAQLLSSDTFQVDIPGYVRLLTRDPATGEALTDVPVTVALARGDEAPVELFAGRTNEFGELAAALQAGEALAGAGELIVRLDTPTGPQEIRAAVAVERATKVLVTTDKPLYQPGQVIHLRALALRRPDLGPDANRPVVWEIFDGKDNKVERLEVQTDAFGIAHTTFQLAREVNQGRYRIVATVGETVTEKTVNVERYVLPKFDLDVDLDRDVYFAGDRIVGTIHAKYFFGEAVAGATVALTASTLDAGETVFANLQGATNENGLYRFEISVPDYIVGLPLEQGGGLIQLALAVTDSAGQARTVSQLVRVAKGPLEVFVVPESGSYVAGVEQKLLLRSLDAAGSPVAATFDVKVNGVALEPVQTDANGMGHVWVDSNEPQIAVEVQAARGEDRIEQTYTFVAGDPSPEGAVLVRTDASLYQVGDTLKVEAQVVGAPDRVFLDVIRGGQTVLTETIKPDGNGLATYELTLTPDHAGPLKIGVYYLAQGSSLRRDTATVYVDLANALKVEMTTDKAVYAPGEEAELTLRVVDADGNGQAAAIGLQGVDEAVYSLMEFRPGLENTYFRIEGELGEPRYQVGVPGLATLVGGGAADADPVRQAQAGLLFAAAGDEATHPIAINTLKKVTDALPGIIRPELQARLEALGSRIEAAARNSSDLATFDVAGFVAAQQGSLYDPWGRVMPLAHLGEWRIQATSHGPDEIPGTGDDQILQVDLINKVFPPAPVPEDDFAEAGGGGPPNAAGGDRDNEDGAADPEEGGGGGGVRVRRNFPETLFVEPAVITDGDGRATLRVPLADSITTWRVSALANSQGGLLGSNDAGIRVFQDFFVDIDFPATLTRGDEFHVPVALYNYLEVPQVVTLTIQEGDWYTLLGGERVIRVPLDAGEVAGVRIPVRVDRVGLHELTVIAEGDALADGVARTVLVEPDGQKVEGVVSGALDGNIEKTVTIPADAIEGSGGLFVKLFPGVLSQVIDGMEGILQMPSGCFEQTSASTWPNVLVAKYMQDTNTGSPETLVRAHEYINTGYQRLLTFEVPGGGFEWFGAPPSHTVLTAYGLLEFTDMASVRVVDEDMLARTRAWLLSQQKDDGHWETTRGYDETGQLSDPVPVTAYIAFALAAAGERGPAMDKAKTYLNAHFDDLGTYSLALATNFMVAYQPGDVFTTRLLEKLAVNVEALVDGAVGQHWQTDEQTTTYGMGEPAFIETTALATHALLAARAYPNVADQALQWLVTKKSPGGAWGSTAGTVWTIKCLLKSLEGGRDENADATVRVVLDGIERASFRVTPETSDVVRQADLSAWLTPGEEQTVTIVKEGEGTLQYGIVTRHHQPWVESPPAEGPLAIEVTYDRTDLAVDDTVTARVTVTNNDLAFADMVMVDLGIPPGFELVRPDLDALVGRNVFRRYEATERQLLIYFDAVMPDQAIEFEYRLVARDPIRAQAPRTRVYSYYNPEVGAEAEPIEFQVD